MFDFSNEKTIETYETKQYKEYLSVLKEYASNMNSSMNANDIIFDGTKCYAKITTDTVGMYVCEEGFVASGNKCYKNSFHKAIKKYTCSKVHKLNGEKYEFFPLKLITMNNNGVKK